MSIAEAQRVAKTEDLRRNRMRFFQDEKMKSVLLEWKNLSFFLPGTAACKTKAGIRKSLKERRMELCHISTPSSALSSCEKAPMLGVDSRDTDVCFLCCAVDQFAHALWCGSSLVGSSVHWARRTARESTSVTTNNACWSTGQSWRSVKAGSACFELSVIIRKCDSEHDALEGISLRGCF